MANGDVDTEVGDQLTQSTAETNLPTAAPKAELVQQPSDNAPRATPADPDAKQKEYYEQKRIEWFQKDEDQRQKQADLIRSYWDKIQATKNAAHPRPPQLEKELPYPGSEQDPNRNKQNVGQIFGQVAALATVAAVVFGKRHGQWGRAIQQMGIGEFLKNYAAGQHEQAKEQLWNWQKGNEVIRDNNRQRVQDYKDILSDSHLTLSEQHQLIAELSQARQDYKLSSAAAAKDLAGILKNFADKDKADTHNSKANLAILNTVHKEYFTNKSVRSWVDSIRDKTGKDPLESPEALRDAEKKYPMSDWVKDNRPFDKDKGISQTESGNPIVKNADDYNALKSGQTYVDPDGITRVKP